MSYRIPKHRPVRLTTAQWHTELLAHVPTAAWKLSREDVLEIRQKRRPIRPGAMPEWDERLTVDELVRVFSYRLHTPITASAIEFITRMPHELVAHWMSLGEQAREQSKHLV